MPQVKKENIHNQILDAALKLFATKGYRDTSISDIAKLAGISVGNVYRYYKGKSDILQEVVPKEFVAYAKQKFLSKIGTGKTGNLLEQLDNKKYIENSQLIMKDVIANRLRILAILKCDEKSYETLKQEILDYIVQSFMEGFITDLREREEKRDTIRFLYKNFLLAGVEILSSDHEEQVMIQELVMLTRYHVSGLASLV